MDSILQTFGINWYLVIAQIVNFLVIFYLLKRFVYKPVFSMLKKREELAKQTITDNQKGKAALDNAEKERAAVIKKAREEARQILDDAKNESYEILETAQVKAKKQAEVTLKEGHDTMDREIRIAEEKLEKRIGTLVETIMKESLSDLLTPDEQKEILKQTLKRVSKTA